MNNWGKEKHSFGRWLLCILTALVLTACGSGDEELPLAPSSGTGTVTPPVVTPSSGLSFFAPAASAEVEVNTNAAVGVTYLDSAGAPKVGQTLYFTSSRGTLSAASAVTDASGKATVTLNSSSAGPASIKANTASGAEMAIRTVLFVSKTPARISVQAEQTTLAKGASTAITATVLDSSGNPVKGKIVGFTLVSDTSGGQLSDATATTNAVGKATVTYTAGTVTTATNGVAIRAAVQGFPAITTNPPVSGPAPLDAQLTVSGSATFISLTSTNTISAQDSTRYALPYGVQVTDATGNAVANTTVTLSVTTTEYYKGEYVWDSTARVWVATSSAGVCINEDANLNNILDSGEDLNGNAMLDPRNPVSVPLSVTTDSLGLASFSIVYGKDYAYWMKVRLKATASVAGSESVITKEIIPPAMSDDVNSEDQAPPGGGPSPFGTAASCADPS